MALLVGDVIDSARDRHVAFDRERCPQGMAIRMLSEYAIELHGKVMEIDEDVLRVEFSTNLPLAVFANGIALPANRTVVSVAALATGANARTFPVDLIPAEQRFDYNTPAAAAWQIGDVLYLRGDAQQWLNVASIAIATVPIPAPLTRSTDALFLPDTAKRALAENVALAFALRGHSDEALPAIDTAAFAARAARAEESYLDEVRNRLTGRSFHTRDVMFRYRDY
jgi:hypothetical protein